MNGKKLLGMLGVVLALALAVAGCGTSSSPAAPSSSSPSGASSVSSGATINGTVAGTTSGSAAGYAKLDNSSGITVTVVGTNLTVSVDGQGRFVLTGVPEGTVQLVFSSNGSSATLTLSGVQATDKIVIKVTLKGSSATLDTEERNGAAMTELEDRIVAINPDGTTRTIDVGSTRVSVPTTAVIRHGGDTSIAFSQLQVGNRVHVRGTMSGSLMTATEVNVQNTNDKVPVNASGPVSALAPIGGGCPTIRFVVAGWTVETAASTDFQKAGCSAIANGTSVHVKGDVQASGRVLASWVQVNK